MAYNTPYTFIALQALTSSQMNGIQDNIRALWPYTTEGDISYASASDTLARLGKGALGKKLLQGENTPFWGSFYGCNFLTMPTQSINNNSLTDITTSSTEWVDYGGFHEGTNGYITIPANLGNSLYLIGCTGFWQAHATAGKSREVYLNIGSGSVYLGQSNTTDDGNNTFHQTIIAYYALASGNTVRISVRQTSGGALNFTPTSFWCIKA